MFKRRQPLTRVEQVRRLLWPRMGIRRQGRYYAIRVSRIQGTPHSIAIGLASGMFMGFTPFFGLHVPLSIALAWLLRGRLMASVLGTLVANPWTYPAIWFAAYRLGCLLLGQQPGHDSQTHLTLTFLLEHPWRVFAPMLAGGSVLGLAFAIPCYLVAKPVIRLYQQRRIDRRRAKWPTPVRERE